MTISLKHAFVSGKGDGADSSLVQPSNWNAEHTLSMATARLVGRTTAGDGAAEEISVSSSLSLSAGVLGLATDITVAGNISVGGTVDGVDIAARDHDAVTFTGTGTYISLLGQQITVDPITESDISDLGAYITGITGEPLGDLQDVTITSVTNNELLMYSGGTWINRTQAEMNIVSSTITGVGNYVALWSGQDSIGGNSTLTYDGSTLSATGAIQASTTLTALGGTLNVGANDTTPGVVNVYGGAATEVGGVVRIYHPADEDSASNEYIEFEAASGNIYVQRSDNTNLMVLEGDGDVQIPNGGLSFGSRVASGATDNSAHLALYSTTYGINVTSNNLNFVANGNNNFSVTNSTATSRAQHNFNVEYKINHSYTVATLPTASVGLVTRVTDASAPAMGSTVSGGGSAAAMVWYNGTNWTVIGI